MSLQAPACLPACPPCRERVDWERQDTERDATIDRLKTEVAQLREGNRALVESSSKQTQLLERAQQQGQDEQQRVGELRRLAGEERERSTQALKARRLPAAFPLLLPASAARCCCSDAGVGCRMWGCKRVMLCSGRRR